MARTTKKRAIFTSKEQVAPLFQYKIVGEYYWMDLPWFVSSFYEAYSFVTGKGLGRAAYRRIDSYREGAR